MTTSTEDLDRFTNSLSAELGIDTVALLSAEEEERQFIGAEALAAYAVYLVGIFASAFLESLKNGLKSEAKGAGKMLAEALINRVKSAVTKLRKPAQTSERDRREAFSTVDDALREMAAYPEVAVALQAAERAGQAQIAAELKAKGMADAEAQKKAERLMRTIVSRMTTA
jgi:hypothetical protein